MGRWRVGEVAGLSSDDIAARETHKGFISHCGHSARRQWLGPDSIAAAGLGGGGGGLGSGVRWSAWRRVGRGCCAFTLWAAGLPRRSAGPEQANKGSEGSRPAAMLMARSNDASRVIARDC